MMGRLAQLLAVTLAVVCNLVWAQRAVADDADTLAIGRRIYREGVLASGKSLRGIGQADVVLSGADAACATCHRRSGYGSSEGPIEVRAITGPALFGQALALPAPRTASAPVVASIADLAPAEAARAKANALREARSAAFAGNRQRPAYDEATLARAIREGVDVTGRSMSPSMPRYALEARELEALSAYLKTLSTQASPGVSEDKVHFATVIQPGVDPAQRQALIDVLRTFMRDRNLGQRTEVRREQAGQVRLGRTFREWVLHVWDLSGDSATWARQLADHNAQQPVFALVSGMGRQSWRPIHDFSERFEIPGILPQADVPVLADHDVYTVYLSKGMTLEAQALVQFLRTAGERGPVTQIYRRDDPSTAGAEAFRQAWAASGAGGLLTDRLLDGPADAAFWQALARQTANATLVLWLQPQDLAQAQALTVVGSPVKTIYLSSGLNPGRRSGLAADGTGRVRLIYPQELPALSQTRLDAVRRWLRNNGIAPADEKVQMNAYLAATVTGMLLSHGQDTYSREFLLERMEHRLGTAIELSIYPHMSLGPGQRYASKGSYIVDVGGEDDRQLKPVSDWIVP
jgi:hypothetical protein